MRVFGLTSRIPAEKRPQLLEACNALNCADECIGKMACEICARTVNILNDEYNVFMNVLYA